MRGLALITAVFLLAGGALGGAASLGRLLLAVGLPGWAAALVTLVALSRPILR